MARGEGRERTEMIKSDASYFGIYDSLGHILNLARRLNLLTIRRQIEG